MNASFLDDVKKTVRSFDKPYPGFKVGVMVMNDDSIWLVVYENEIMAFDDEQRANILLYLERVRDEIRKSGIRVEIGGQPGDPPTGRRG